MKINSKKSNYLKRVLNKKYDTIYMNTDSLYSIKNNKNIALNIKTIEISKKYVEEDESYLEIYDTSANNIYFEGYKNYGDITIPIDFMKEENITLNIYNENLPSNFKKINITKDDKILETIDLDKDITNIDIDYYNDSIDINIRTNKKTLIYNVNINGKTIKKMHMYSITKEDLDEFGNLDLRMLNYSNLHYENMDIDTLIVDKDIFKNVLKYNFFGSYNKNNKKFNINNIRLIDNNDMKLIPFDKTFEPKKILLSEGNCNYMYIDTGDDEVVIFLDNDNELKCISKNELLKDDNISSVYFRFRNQIQLSAVDMLNPLSIIIKFYKDDRIQIFDLNSVINIDDNFKMNMEMNLDKLKNKPVKVEDYINNNDYLGLFNAKKFNNNLLRDMCFINTDSKLLEMKGSINGLSNNAIKYLKYRGILEELLKIKLTNIEIDKFNELGDSYKKILKK